MEEARKGKGNAGERTNEKKIDEREEDKGRGCLIINYLFFLRMLVKKSCFNV